ncbi:hypothetical protein SELMODRAFT_415231 [Selaginella moellendorffii]|uniref:Uncharacterized protein n=1 Tax=Selaginella moellendorffii TaxID=88036 RepID=D8RVF6_SELML|nr:hypothetical protein SELMODRAFT_415231 [Selaginella moellendorffii]
MRSAAWRLGMPLGAFIIWKILDRLRRQAQLLASLFFGVAHEVKTKPTAPVKQDQDLHSLLGNMKDELPDLIDSMEDSPNLDASASRPLPFPDSRNSTMELECLEKFQQEFKDKLKHS